MKTEPEKIKEDALLGVFVWGMAVGFFCGVTLCGLLLAVMK